eukprot:CAMPEP_0115867114 /NCGR_PEP_ID=MMETSP0287-20121206/20600_1 /TAXON_ID=412157 /ORGANISM="Chrysochromulina rotalis, Strain UIO044" /LENGTH=209 /DNA_ID=CAMNT_0003321707 /DNA_START=60 /DNA_END=686 /DNA_ORIENTATION=+
MLNFFMPMALTLHTLAGPQESRTLYPSSRVLSQCRSVSLDSSCFIQDVQMVLQDMDTDGCGGNGGSGRGDYGSDGDDDDRGNDPNVWQIPIVSKIWQAYSAVLDSQPLLTKSATAGFVGGLGDLVAQRMEEHSQFDLERFLAVVFDGTFVSGPGLHLGYHILEKHIPCACGGSVRNVLMQVAVDELLFDPIFVGAFFFSTGAVEHKHPW